VKRKNKRKLKQKPDAVEQKPGTAKQEKQEKENAQQEPAADEAKLFNKKDVFISCGIFFITLVVYILTLAPTVYFGDSGELSAAAYNLGIAHPPGYPLYLLFGKLFMVLVPIGDMAARMNLLSAFFASLTAVMVYLIGRELKHRHLTAASVAFIAAFSLTFWSQAVVAEVYTLSALFFCLMIFFTLLWMKDKKERWLMFLALTGGLALTHHVIIALFYPVFFIFILSNRPRLRKKPKLLAQLTALFLLPLLLYLYLPISSASDPVNDWGNPGTLSAMMEHITAKQFGGLFLKHGMDGFLHQFNIFLQSMFGQFPFFLLILTVIGVISGFKRRRKFVLFFLALFMLSIFYSLAYYITDIEPHFIYIFLVLVLFMGRGFEYIYSWLEKAKIKEFRWLGKAMIVILALLPLLFNWGKCDQSDNYLARNYGQNMINSLEKNGVLFIDSEAELFIVAYLKIVDRLRPDVEVYDVRQNIFFIPLMKEKGKKEVTIEHLYKFAREKLTEQRPVYFTNPIFGNFKYAEYGVLYRAFPREAAPPPLPPDPWGKYDLSGLDGTYLDANAKETAGKYYFTRAKYLAKTSQIDSAKDFLDKAIAAAGDRHVVLKQICMFYMGVRQYYRARELLEKAVKLDPFDSDDYNMLGMIAHHKKEYNEALENYSKVLELRGDNISALMNRGILYEQMGDNEANVTVKKAYYRNALKDLEQSKKLEPVNPTITQLMNRVSHKLSR
jgi:tetratricopeptide (TPR) repeat protein